MPLALSQVESFLLDLSELFTVRPPRVSRRRRIRCRWKKKTLHVGRKITRNGLAHELAHFLHAEFKLRDGCTAASFEPGSGSSAITSVKSSARARE